MFSFVFCLTLFVCLDDWPEFLLLRLGYSVENRPSAFTAASSVGKPIKHQWLVWGMSTHLSKTKMNYCVSQEFVVKCHYILSSRSVC